MKDQMGKEMKREFAPNKRPKKEDQYKIRIIPKEPDYTVTKDENKRIVVHPIKRKEK